MKKTYTNGEVFTMAQVLFGGNGNEGLVNKRNLKTRMAVRQALKFNYISITNAHKVIDEMVKEVLTELSEELVEQGKITKENENYKIKEEYKNEILMLQQERLDELSDQKVDVDLYMIPESEFIAYAKQNDGELTYAELDVLESFVEKKEEEKTEE